MEKSTNVHFWRNFMNKTNYKELVEKYGTPLYIFDSSEAKERINGIKEILPKKYKTLLCNKSECLFSK